MTNPFGAAGDAKYVLLTTFKKDGTPVGTPLWGARDGERLYVWTPTDSWKVKRIKRNPKVTVAACDMRGTPSGEAIDGSATILDGQGTDRVRDLLRKKYGILGWLTVQGSILRRGKSGTVGIEIVAA
ncbi:PPOX class F420-dependent oxidoreductase [Skermania sp. ID1734]|uniref:PPOX class F420-dependent oxidoreductase n=1 Tax=Skermania sp. ID1734 TaxID=2597516 RepID=UPI00117D0783|nr:PPOX class F420-dependent oxidoreductase [Skermania sp. ID1734]TSE01626.1 PPOX class F420-dependent oxidoreductase [Skermania sp. ID1734]